MENGNKTVLIGTGEKKIALTPGALKFLVRHSLRDRLFVFMEPYPDEVEPNWEPATLIAESVAVGWFVSAPALDVVTHWAKVDDLKAALQESGLSTKGKRSELLQRCLSECTAWVAKFAASKAAYCPTDKGRIELQATRQEVVPVTKESHRQQMLEYYERDRKDARESEAILGIKIWPRDDSHWPEHPCPRAASFSGVFLPEELPELYPNDCPNDYACCCINREMVLSCDDSEDSKFLRKKIADRGLPEPPPPWGPIEPVTEEKRQEMVEMAKTALKDPSPRLWQSH